jgi:hypothetical protein
MNGYIHLELMANRSKKEYLRVYESTYEFYKSRGHKPTAQRLDNETSSDLENFLCMERVEVQYAPPGIHQQNPSERAICYVKNALIAMCATTDPAFPAENLFEDAIPQAEIVINILRPWHTDRTRNAWTGMHNKKPSYDHMAHPLSIYGMKVVVHDKPDARVSWAPHGTDGFYVAPAMQHYLCWKCYMPLTRSMRITDTVAWLPEVHKMPGHSATEVLSAAVGAYYSTPSDDSGRHPRDPSACQRPSSSQVHCTHCMIYFTPHQCPRNQFTQHQRSQSHPSLCKIHLASTLSKLKG